jgi:predicted Zn-dependent peptidase
MIFHKALRNSTWLTLIIGSLLALPALQAQEIDIPFEKFTLDNGLTVIVHEDRKAPVVAVAVWYKVGSKDEPAGKTGFAHLFEHLMFNGTEHYDDEWFKPLQEVGATGLNGTTSFDYTNYFQTVPTTALDRILWMESDRMGHLLGAVTQEKLDEQRGVVQNEKRQGEDQPYGMVFDSIIANLFPDEHPYSHLPIGSMEDLNDASLDDVKDWFEKFYGAANAIVVLSGDINATEARPLVEKYFGHIDAGPPLTKVTAWVPQRTDNSREVMQDKVPQTRIYRVWVAPEDNNPVSSDLSVAASILGDGKNSRLYKELAFNQQIATDAGVFNYELKLASIFGVYVDVAPGQDPQKVEAEMEKVLNEFLDKRPSSSEVKLVTTKTKASIIRGLEQVGGFSGKAVTLASGELIAGDPGYINTELARLAAVTPKSVQRAANRWLKDGWHQLTVEPFPEYTSATAQVDRTTGLPDVTGETQLSFPNIERATLSNGLEVVFARRATVPVVNIAVSFDAGYAADANGTLGVANFTTAMLDEGAGKLDALELAAELETLGATLGAGSNLDSTIVSMSALTDNLEDSLAIFGDVLLRPTFAESDIERVRKLILSSIAQQQARPTSIAINTLPPLMYGDGHAYGIPFSGTGTAQSVAEITREQLISFKQQWLRPDNARLFVVGDTTLATIVDLLEDELGDWQAKGTKPTKSIAEVALPEQGRVIIIDRPGSAQSLILAGHLVPPTGVANNIAIQAMNETLGGTFTARVNMNLREDKGWAYGAYTFMQDAKGQRPFFVYAPVQTDKTVASIAELLKEINAYQADRPPTVAELAAVVADNTRSLPGQYETSGAVLSAFLTAERFGRALDYPTSLPAQYNALDVSQLQEAAKIVQPNKLIWLIVGDASQFKDELAELGLGEISVQAM